MAIAQYVFYLSEKGDDKFHRIGGKSILSKSHISPHYYLDKLDGRMLWMLWKICVRRFSFASLQIKIRANIDSIHS